MAAWSSVGTVPPMLGLGKEWWFHIGLKRRHLLGQDPALDLPLNPNHLCSLCTTTGEAAVYIVVSLKPSVSHTDAEGYFLHLYEMQRDMIGNETRLDIAVWFQCPK